MVPFWTIYRCERQRNKSIPRVNRRESRLVEAKAGGVAGRRSIQTNRSRQQNTLYRQVGRFSLAGRRAAVVQSYLIGRISQQPRRGGARDRRPRYSSVGLVTPRHLMHLPRLPPFSLAETPRCLCHLHHFSGRLIQFSFVDSLYDYHPPYISCLSTCVICTATRLHNPSITTSN